MRGTKIKSFENIKNFKKPFLKKNQKFNSKIVNIKIFREDKLQNNLNEDKNLNFLNNSFSNNNESSPLIFLNSSFNSFYSVKKKKYMRLKKRDKSNSASSQRIYSNTSFSSLSSDSSNLSYRSRKNKRKNYINIMMAKEDDLYFLRKKDIGLFSGSEEEENDNPNDIYEQDYGNEIERILIEIYNKNITLINSGEHEDNHKKEYEIKKINHEITKYLRKKNFKTNLIVLKCLGEKIKELIIRYKEKILEIDEIKTTYDIYKKKLLQKNNPTPNNNNTLGNNIENNSNNSTDNISDAIEVLFNDNNRLNLQVEVGIKDIICNLLKELCNIKETLIVSAKEIEGIFEYPLKHLKNEKGNKIKFSFKLIQIEEYCKTLLHNDFINFLLTKAKESISKFPNIHIKLLIDKIELDCDHKNEMTRFIKFINEKLGISNENNENNQIENNNNSKNYKSECKISDCKFGESNAENNNKKKKRKRKRRKKKDMAIRIIKI